MRRLGVLYVGLLLIGACSGATDAVPSALSTTTSSPSNTTVTTEVAAVPVPGSALTSTTAQPTTNEPAAPTAAEVGLRSDGLGLVDFGDPDYEVMALVEDAIGSLPTDPGNSADWVEYIGWDDIGLYLGLSRPMWSEFDGVARLVGWQYSGGSDVELLTTSGVGVGATMHELVDVYGDELVFPTEPDECTGLFVQLRGEDEGIGALLDDDGTVQALWAGLQVGC